MELDNPKRRNRILLVLFVGVLMGALDIAIVGPALPAIQAYFDVSDRGMAWVFTIYVLFNLIGTPLMAKLSDIFGRRSIYVLNVTLFAVGSLQVAAAPLFGLLLFGRAMQGLGAGGIFPVATAVVGDTFPPERRGSALGLIGAVFGMAFLVGPILAGVILAFFSWHWLFLLNLPIALAIVAASLRLLPETRPKQRQPFDWPGMVTLGLMLGALTYGITHLNTEAVFASLRSPAVWPFLGLAIVLLPFFVRIEQRAVDPIVRIALFRARQVHLAGALAAGAGLGEAAVVFVPALLVAAFGVSHSKASFMLLPAVLAMSIGSPVAGRLLDRLGSRMVVVGGGLVTTGGMALLGLFGTHLMLYYGAIALVGLGLGVLLGAPLRYIMLNEAQASERAAAQGILTLFTSVGQLVGGALVGAVVASRGGGVSGYTAAYLGIAAIHFLLTLLALGLKGRAAELATLAQHEGPAVPELAGQDIA